MRPNRLSHNTWVESKFLEECGFATQTCPPSDRRPAADRSPNPKAIYYDTICWFIIRFWKPRKLLPDTWIISQVLAKIPEWQTVSKMQLFPPPAPKANTEEAWMAYRFSFRRPELSAGSPRMVWPTGYWLGTNYWKIGKPDRKIRGTIEEKRKKCDSLEIETPRLSNLQCTYRIRNWQLPNDLYDKADIIPFPSIEPIPPLPLTTLLFALQSWRNDRPL